jgi:hypothetical protein
MTFNAAQATVAVICIMVLIVLFRLLKYQHQRFFCYCQASFYRCLSPVLPWHALINTALISVIGRRIGDWLLVMLWGLDLGCLALAKNAIEGSAVAIKEPRHV